MNKDILTIKEVAEELNATELAVNRLVARGTLKAIELGTDPHRPWRVMREALLAFVSAGATDLVMPTINRGWFDDRDLSDVNFPKEIALATQTQRLTDDQIRSLVKRNPGVRSFTHRLDVSPSVRRVITTKLSEKCRFRTLGEDHLALQVRAIARKEMKPLGTLPKFYASPDEYNRIFEAAVRKLLGAKVAHDELRSVDASVYTITYELPHGAWASDSVIEVAHRAF